MNSISRRRLMFTQEAKPRLPDDFQELEFLESSGTEFVDSGQRGVAGSEFEISFANPSGWVLGVVPGKGQAIDFGVFRTAIRYGTQYAENLDIPSKSVVKVNRYDYTINGVTSNWASTANYIGDTHNIQLFGAKGSSASFACIIYYYKHKINGVLVQHLIPCYQKSTDINGFYDLVNNVFHEEQGGKLIRGAEVHYNEEKFLKHWWSGEDALVGGILLDRMGTDFGWQLQGNPQRVNNAWVFDRITKYGISTILSSQCDLGNHFAIELDADLNSSIFPVPSAFLDFSAIGQANKNVGFTCVPNGVTCAWKMQGNDSSPIRISNETNYPSYMKLPSGDVWTSVKVRCEIRDRGNGYDEFVVTYNGYSYIYEPNVPKVRYNDFYTSTIYNITNASLSRGATETYGIGMKLRNLKIYVFD